MELCQGWFRLGVKKSFFTEMVFGHWNGLPKEVVMITNLLGLKKHLDNAVSHMV